MEILLALGVFGGAVALLSLGTLYFRRPLKGSCGGVATALGEGADETCSVCGRSSSDCPDGAPEKAAQ